MTTPSDIEFDFTATGDSPAAIGRTGGFSVAGTFVGTVQLIRIVNGAEQVLVSLTAPTGAGDDVSFDNGYAAHMLFRCSAFTSGTIECRLVGESWSK